MNIGAQIITDEWDHIIRVLLSPDLDKLFNIFQLSFYMDVIFQYQIVSNFQNRGKTFVYVFKSNISQLIQDFTPSSWYAIRKLLKQIPTAQQQEIFQQHYKCTILNSWGSTELKSKLKTFDFGEGDYSIAHMHNLDGLNTPLSSFSILLMFLYHFILFV